MDIDKILSLINAVQHPPEIQGEVKELIEILIETPGNAAASERLLFLLGVGKLEVDTQKTVTENLQAVIEVAAKHLLENISKTELERRKIKHEYLSKVNESGDVDIAKLAKQMPVKKNEWSWNRGFGSDPIKETKGKISKDSYKWVHGGGLSPLSGKKYGGNK